jgi:uncharacterized protein
MLAVTSIPAIGIGLRASHYGEWLAQVATDRAPYVECITENILHRGGRSRAVVFQLRRDYSVFLHGVSLSIGGVDPLDMDYLKAVGVLAQELEAQYVSDHACFGMVGGISSHDLWPLPNTKEVVEHLVSRIAVVQETLRRPIVLENVSSYLRFANEELREDELLAEVVRRTGCKVLLDINNLVVSVHNHGFDAHRYLETLPVDAVAYLHVAGHSQRDGYRFDDHSALPDEETMGLLRAGFARFGPVPCIFEWDENVPSLAEYQLAAERLAL